MKKLAFMILIFLYLMIGCSPNNQPELTRIDVESISPDETKNGEVRMIVDQESIRAIEKAFVDIKWEPNTKVSMAREEDVLATFFYMENKNMPERLIEYKIWFEGGTATLISNHQNEGYGRLLNERNVRILQNELMDDES